jgi:hypothetical protein
LKKFANLYILSGYFVIPSLTISRHFADPSQKLRASPQDSAPELSFFSHSEPLLFVILPLSEAKGKNLHRRPFGLRLSVTEKGSF